MGLILLVILIVLLFSTVPRWKHSKDWGYAPSGPLGIRLVVLLIMLLLGYIPFGLQAAP